VAAATAVPAAPGVSAPAAQRRRASPAGARAIGTAVTVGALGVGPLIAGGLAQWVTRPLTVAYLVFIVLGRSRWPACGPRPRRARQLRRRQRRLSPRRR
jgi:hypothetical protein